MPPDNSEPHPPPADPRQVPRGHAQILAAGLSLDLFYRTLAGEAPDAIVYADAGGMIRFWNRGAERIFGYTAAEALGRSLDIIVPEDLRARHWQAYGNTVRTGRTRYGAGEVLAVPASRKGGVRVQIEFTLLPFHGRDGRTLGVAAILREVTRHAAAVDASTGE